MQQIIFIHGLSENAHSWGHWVTYFEKLGYNCHAPNYPYHDGEPAELRQYTNPALGKIKFADVVERYKKYITEHNLQSAILIGHSMGGLIVQKLMEAQLGSKGVCITSAPPQGIFTTKWSFIKANLPTINPFKGSSLFLGSKAWFHYGIANALSQAESDIAYDKVMVPESRNIPRSSTGKQGAINFKQPHKPLLFIGAELDHIVPIVLNRKNHKAYKDPNSICDFKEFKGRCHYICAQQGWEEVAQYVADWVGKH